MQHLQFYQVLNQKLMHIFEIMLLILKKNVIKTSKLHSRLFRESFVMEAKIARL